MTKREGPAECFISVNVETSGPIPGNFSLLTIGACIAGPETDHVVSVGSADTFYCTLKPLEEAGSDPAALQVTGLSLDELTRNGSLPAEAMLAFERWVTETAEEAKPVFVGLNAAFDWSFVNYYFHRFLGRNPFGFAALDIKSLYMGATGSTWKDTRSSQMAKTLGVIQGEISHQALDDAQAQAALFAAIQELIKRPRF